jgi:hypothetical protein
MGKASNKQAAQYTDKQTGGGLLYNSEHGNDRSRCVSTTLFSTDAFVSGLGVIPFDD